MMAERRASFSRSSRMYPRQSAEPVDHASRAARRLNAVATSLSLCRVYGGTESAQWHFPGLRVMQPSARVSDGLHFATYHSSLVPQPQQH
jgi:hypothetical protein